MPDLTDEKFQELADITVSMVEAVAFKGDEKALDPVLFVHHRSFVEGGMMSDIEHSIVMIADGFGDEEHKRRTLRQIGARFFEEKLFPVAIFMASEAWMSTIDANDIKDVDLDKLPMPSQDPNRKECIMIAGRSTDCKIGVNILNIPIIHDKDGNMIRNGENVVTKELEMYLLNQFFHGFFEKVAGKGGSDKDVRSKRDPLR